MSTHGQPLLSEEDIRTRVVTTWLADHGFTAESISVEFSFELRLGRNIYRVGDNSAHSATFRPRADILVKSADGKNLLIVEVKAPNEKLDDNVKEQGISYARLLRDGGIAPFVVVTNGRESHIYDSITGESVHDVRVPTNHPHVQNGFRVKIDDLALRAEALETFVSLSSDNLLAFCQAQASQRMRLLRGDDPFSGKKYIPALYIEREDAKKHLNRLLDKENRPVVVLIGAPQVGKTNFVCHTVEKRLELRQPCLFYPAIGMQRGLLEEISEDFSWILHSNNAPQQIAQRLNRILQQTGQKLVIFIDGWNEASQSLARAIDRGSERLSCDGIQIVVSFTNVVARRLLLDEAGNLSFVAESASISTQAAAQIEVSPEKIGKNQSRVFITRYSLEEIENAYTTYSQFFKVIVPSRHQKIAEPLLLRIGMQQFEGKELPEALDEPQLLEQSILSKISRVSDFEEDSAKIFLQETANEIFIEDAPVSQSAVLERCGLPIVQAPPRGLFEAALLTKVFGAENLPKLDFYYSRERDFVIALWARAWISKFSYPKKDFSAELTTAAQTQAGSDALRWFLSQLNYQNHLRLVAKDLESYDDSRVRKLLLSSIWETIKRRTNNDGTWITDGDWVIDAMYSGISDPDTSVKVEAAKLMPILIDSYDELASMLTEDMELIIGLLSVEEDFPLGKESIGSTILDAVRDLHARNLGACLDSNSGITDSLAQIMELDNAAICRGAAKAFAYLAPETFLTFLSKKIEETLATKMINNSSFKFPSEYTWGIEMASEALEKIYFGGIDEGYLFGCPEDIGDLERMIDDISKSEEEICLDLIHEYRKIRTFYVLFSKFYDSHVCLNKLEELVNAILKFVERYATTNNLTEKVDKWLLSPPFENPCGGYLQLSFDFGN